MARSVTLPRLLVGHLGAAVLIECGGSSRFRHDRHDHDMEEEILMKRNLQLGSMVLVVLAVVAACGGGGGPANTARDWFAAISSFDFNRVKELTCSEQQGALDQALGLFDGAGEDFDLSALGELFEIDTSGLQFTESNVTETSANVQISGKLKITIFGQSEEQDVDQSVPMVNEGGWKVCSSDFDLPGQ